MKKGLLSILASALLVVGCQNYDDQFSNLESQISALATTVAGLSQVQSDLSSLAGTVASLASTVNGLGSTIDTAVANGLADIQADVDAITTAVADVASSEEVDALSTAVAAAGADLDELLANSAVFNGPVSITSVATLNAFHAMGSSLNIVNGAVTFDVSAGMDATKVQETINQMLNVVGDFSYTGAATEAMPTFQNLTGVASLTVKGNGNYDFSALVSAGNIVLNNEYPSKTTVIAFDKLKTYTSFSDDDAGSAALNRVKFSNATNLHLTAVTVLAGSALDVTIDEGGSLLLDGLTGLNSQGTADSVDLDIEGPTSVALTTIQGGNINLKDVKTASISGFHGSIVIDSGVEDLTVVKGVSLDISGATDLEKADINMVTNYASTAVAADALAAAYKDIVFNSQDLTTATLSGKIGTLNVTGQNNLTTVTLADATHVTALIAKDNNDLNSLTVTGATIGNVTLDNNDNLETAVLNHTSYVTATDKGVAISVDGNDDLTSLFIHADKVDDLSIQLNTDLATLNFIGTATVGLYAIGGTTANVAIDNNDLTATLAKDSYQAAAAADAGSYTSTSGLLGLKTYLAAAIAAPGTAGVKVFFDKISAYQVQSGSATAVFTDTTVPAVGYSASNIYSVAYVTANTAAAAVNSTKGKAGFTVDNARVIDGGQFVQIAVDGVNLLAGGAGLTYTSNTLALTGNDTIDIAAIKNAAHTTRATAAGVTIDAKVGGESIGTVSLIDWRDGGIDDTGAVLGEQITAVADTASAALSTAELDSDDVITFTVGSNSVTTSVVSTANSGTNVGAAIIAAWLAKYDGQIGTASAAANVTITNSSGVLSLVALDTGSRGNLAISMSVAAGTGAQSATTGKALDWVIGSTRATSDNTTSGQSLVVTVESIVAGTVLNAVDGSSVVVTPAASTTPLAAATYKLVGADTGAGTYTGASEARNDVLGAEDGTAAASSNASTTDRTLWLVATP